MSLSWRERLQRAKTRLMEQLGLEQEDWNFIKENIGAFCEKSDEQVRQVLESDGKELTQQNIDELVENMYQDEFDEMCRDIILEVLKNFGYKIKKKQKEKEKESEDEDEEKESDSESETESEGQETEEQKEKVEVENKSD